MPGSTKEPQSYGSEKDWTTGNTGQQVNEQKSEPAPEHRDFYDERVESEENDGVNGGLTSPVQFADQNVPRTGASNDEPAVPRVTSEESGAKRDSYFRKRDYD